VELCKPYAVPRGKQRQAGERPSFLKKEAKTFAIWAELTWTGSA
jgi:hypothetical protein